jgi:hypothetical protein
MLQTVLKVVETQSAQMNVKFDQALRAGVNEYNEAQAAYDAAWSTVKNQVQTSYETVSKQFADTTAQFDLINAQNPMGEIRKSYLTVLNRLENEKAYNERLLERLSQVQEEISGLEVPLVGGSAVEAIEGNVQVDATAQGETDAAEPQYDVELDASEKSMTARRRQRTESGANTQATDRSAKYKSLFFFEQDTLRAAHGEDSQGSATSLIAAVLKASSVTDMVVPPELLGEVALGGDEAPIMAAVTPFSRGNSLQDIVIPDMIDAEPSPAESTASDVTVNSAGPAMPDRPAGISLATKGPDGVPSMIPARLMQQLANAEPGSSASIRAVRDNHSVAKMLKHFEDGSTIAEEVSPAPRSRSTSASRQAAQ